MRHYFNFHSLINFNSTFTQRKEKSGIWSGNVKASLWYPSNARLLIKHFFPFKASFNISKATYQKGFKVKTTLTFEVTEHIHMKTSDWLHGPYLCGKANMRQLTRLLHIAY